MCNEITYRRWHSYIVRICLKVMFFSVCNKWYTRNHFFQVVMDENDVVMCDDTSEANANVKIQIKETKTTEKKYRQFSPAGDLRTHLNMHSGEKSNKCNQCVYASSQVSNLRKHLKTHNGEKPNKCNQCDFASSHADSLSEHLKTHSGEKSNKCNQCDYASSQAGHLRAHLKMHRLDFDRQLGQLTSCLVPVLYPPHNPVPRE